MTRFMWKGNIKATFALMLLSMFAVQGITANILKAAECPATGDSVTFRDVQEVYASMTGSIPPANLTKDEFETTAQFEARLVEERQARAVAAAPFSQAMLLEGIYDPRYVEYDADNEIFVMEHYAWDNHPVASYAVFGSGNPYGIGPLSSLDPVQAMGLTTKRARSRRASKNVIERVNYGVFDSPLPKNQSRELKWVHELRTGKDRTPVVRVPVPLQRAAKLKEQMRIGVVVRPKEPFTATDRILSEMDTTEINTATNLIVADILCAVITDQDGVVLKTVAPSG